MIELKRLLTVKSITTLLLTAIFAIFVTMPFLFFMSLLRFADDLSFISALFGSMDLLVY